MSQHFIDPQFKNILDASGENHFEMLWNMDLEAVEPGNEKGKQGRSFVVRHIFSGAGKTVPAYMKRQIDYMPSRAEKMNKPHSIARREFRNIQAWTRAGLLTVQPLYFAEQHNPLRAILITAALDDYQPFNIFIQSQEAQVLPAIFKQAGIFMRSIHAKGWAHRCFFPWHLFIRANGENYEFRMIDLENARYTFLLPIGQVRDIVSFLKRLDPDIRAAGQSAFLQGYCNTFSRVRSKIVKEMTEFALARKLSKN